LPTAPAGKIQTADRHVRVGDREADSARLFPERLRSGELPGGHARPDAVVECKREHGERAGVTRELHVTVGKYAPAFVVPQL
jgi:hypothetical protein